MNIKSRMIIYIIFGLISVITIIITACFFEVNIIFNILNSIGCSIFSAILLAFVLDIKDYFNKQNEIKQKRTELFENLHKEIDFLIRKILWYEILIEEKEPNLINKSVKEQNSLGFTCYTFEKYKSKIKTFTYEEVRLKLKEYEEKYNLDKIMNLSNGDKEIVNNAFSVIANNSLGVINEINKLEQNKAILDYLNYITINQIETLKNNMSFFLIITNSEDKNFGIAIKLLLDCSDLVRKLGNYKNNIDNNPTTKPDSYKI